VVELQYYRIALTAIDTRVVEQVFVSQFVVASNSDALALSVCRSLLRCAVEISPPVRLLPALFAAVLQPIPVCAVPLELGLVFLFFTVRTTFHAGILQIFLVANN
jgi:hypothetical protein